MAELDAKGEKLVAQALKRAGVRDTDGDSEDLHRYAVRFYRRKLAQPIPLSRVQLLASLTEAVRARRHRGWDYQQEMLLEPGQQREGRYEWLEVSPTRHHDLAHQVQLKPREREVLYLLVSVGMDEAEIAQKLKVSQAWVKVTTAKIRKIYGPVWSDNLERREARW